MNLILASIGVFLVVVLLLVVILLVAKNFLVPSGNVKLTINGEKGTGSRFRFDAAEYAVCQRHLPFLCLRWQGLLRTVQMPGARRWWRNLTFRSSSL